jgi:hypothetical protein
MEEETGLVKVEEKDRFKGMMVTYTKKRFGGHFSKKGKEIIKPNNAKKGMMVALPMGDKVRIGWSLCNFAMGDEFSERGESIAIERAETGSKVPPAASMVKPLEKFIERAKRYYKDKEVEVTFPFGPPELYDGQIIGED